ncbi:MAG: hypothetical protein CMJ23_01355 [Phycisphaerae bacterium]|nr:hypothetical protein [Phycisphaerae bacterium]
MGQVYLGFRSLLVKIAVFVVMAALLAWALGGTLWPKTVTRLVGVPVVVDGTMMTLVDQIGAERSTFGLGVLDSQGTLVECWPRPESKTPEWIEALSPVSTPDGSAGGVAARTIERWTVWFFDDGERRLQGPGLRCFETESRLEAATQLDRIARGLPLEDQPATEVETVESDDESSASD